MAEQKTQIIVSQGHKGHRLMYVRLLAKAALGKNRVPVLVLPLEAKRSVEFRVHLADLPEGVQIIYLGGRINVRGLAKMLPSSSEAMPVVFSEGDSWLARLFFSPRLRGGATALVMRKPNAVSDSPFRPARIAAKSALIWGLRAVRGYQVFLLQDAISSPGGKWAVADPVTMSADPSDRERLRDEWAALVVNKPRYWVGVVGGIGPRKNVPFVSEAVASLGSDFGLVVAGEAEAQEADIEEWLSTARRAGTSVVRIEGTLSEHHFDSIVAALDVVVVAHSNEGPSGILAKAVLAETPVAAAGAQSLRLAADSSDGAVAWSELEAHLIADSIQSLVSVDRKMTSRKNLSTSLFTDRLLSASPNRGQRRGRHEK